jgi:hypothetical protein
MRTLGDMVRRALGVGMRRRFQARVDRLSLPAGPVDATPVSGEDLSTLPSAAQRYLRFMGVVGRPRDWSFRARFVGEFRQRPGQKFLPCEAWQYNTALVPARIYYMRITFAGVLPMLGVDVYRAGHGHMRGRLLGLITVADGSGPEFDIGELTTYVKDALMIAPTMFLVPAVTWTAVDDHSFDVSMSDGGISATSRVFVDERGRMVDFSGPGKRRVQRPTRDRLNRLGSAGDVQDGVDVAPIEVGEEAAGFRRRHRDEFYSPPASFLVDLRCDRERAVRSGADDQPAAAPGDLLIGRERCVAVSSPLGFRGLLDPLAHLTVIDDDVVIVGASVDLDRSELDQLCLHFIPSNTHIPRPSRAVRPSVRQVVTRNTTESIKSCGL